MLLILSKIKVSVLQHGRLRQLELHLLNGRLKLVNYLISMNNSQLTLTQLVWDAKVDNLFLLYYLLAIKGACRSSDYPYTGRQATCVQDNYSKVFSLFNVDSTGLQNNQLSNFKHAYIIKLMSIAFAVPTTSREFYLYKSGIYFGAACSKPTTVL